MRKEITDQYSCIDANNKTILANKKKYIYKNILVHHQGGCIQKCKIDIQKAINGIQCTSKIKGERMWSYL